jgi:hypothetical protein
MEKFKPNKLTDEKIDTLEDWQLLVAVCHFGPQMGDSVDLDYAYEKKGTSIYLDDGICLDGDIDLETPFDTLSAYAGFEWQNWAKETLRRKVGAL